jgi:hypothetical protein
MKKLVKENLFENILNEVENLDLYSEIERIEKICQQLELPNGSYYIDSPENNSLCIYINSTNIHVNSLDKNKPRATPLQILKLEKEISKLNTPYNFETDLFDKPAFNNDEEKGFNQVLFIQFYPKIMHPQYDKQLGIPQ